jgi:HEAT repeat protein
LTNLALDQTLTPWMHNYALRWVTAFSLVQVIAIISAAAYLYARRAYSQHQEIIFEQIRPAIQERVMAMAFEGEMWSMAVPKCGPARHVLDQCIGHALAGLTDSARDRVAKFACGHGFPEQWAKRFHAGSLDERKRALSLLGVVAPICGNALIHSALFDQQPAIRIQAARALLIPSADAADVDRVFRSVLRESLLARALLTSDLKRHARYLMAHTIPSVLAANADPETRNCLQILAVWKLANPGLDIDRLFRDYQDKSHDGLILPLLLELLPYVSVDDSIEDRLRSALSFTDLEVQCASAHAIGQMKLQRLIPMLIPLLPDRTRRLASTAATALAHMGSPGLQELEQVIRGTNRMAAAAALEALEAITVGS